MEAGAEVDAVDNEGMSPLFVACDHGKDTAMKVLLDLNADPNVHIEKGGILAVPPLHIAALHGSLGAERRGRMLLESGADVNAPMGGDRTALHHACGAVPNLYASEGFVQLLVDWGACVNAADRFGRTALHYASKN